MLGGKRNFSDINKIIQTSKFFFFFQPGNIPIELLQQHKIVFYYLSSINPAVNKKLNGKVLEAKFRFKGVVFIIKYCGLSKTKPMVSYCHH